MLFGYPFPPLLQYLKIAAHIADTSHAVCDQQWKQKVPAPGGISAQARKMNVHVPKARNQKFASSVNLLGARGSGDMGRNLGDPPIRNQNVCPTDGSSVHIDDVGSLDEKWRIRMVLSGQKGRTPQ